MTMVESNKAIALMIALLGLTACAGHVDFAQYATFDAPLMEANAGDASGVSFQGLELRTGDVIVSEMDTASSLLMAFMAERYAPFIHAGIIVIDDGKPRVYDAVGTMGLPLGRPPTDAMSGKIRRQSIAKYLRRQSVAAIYRANDAGIARQIGGFAKRAYHERLAFDPYFDLRSTDAVYCTEFVAAALQAAGAPLPRGPAPRNANASLALTLDWLHVDTPAFWLAGDIVAGLTPVATLSRELTVSQIEARFAFKRELHRRFTVEQKLGNLFRWTGFGLRIRAPLVALYDRVVDASVERFVPDAFVLEAQASLGPGPQQTAQPAVARLP